MAASFKTKKQKEEETKTITDEEEEDFFDTPIADGDDNVDVTVDEKNTSDTTNNKEKVTKEKSKAEKPGLFFINFQNNLKEGEERLLKSLKGKKNNETYYEAIKRMVENKENVEIVYTNPKAIQFGNWKEKDIAYSIPAGYIKELKETGFGIDTVTKEFGGFTKGSPTHISIKQGDPNYIQGIKDRHFLYDIQGKKRSKPLPFYWGEKPTETASDKKTIDTDDASPKTIDNQSKPDGSYGHHIFSNFHSPNAVNIVNAFDGKSENWLPSLTKLFESMYSNSNKNNVIVSSEEGNNKPAAASKKAKSKDNSPKIEETSIYDFENKKTNNLIYNPTMQSSILAMVKFGRSHFLHSWYNQNEKGELVGLPGSTYTANTVTNINSFLEHLRTKENAIYDNFVKLNDKYLGKFKSEKELSKTQIFNIRDNPEITSLTQRKEIGDMAKIIQERFFTFFKGKNKFFFPGNQKTATFMVEGTRSDVPLTQWVSKESYFKVNAHQFWSEDYEKKEITPAMREGVEKEKEYREYISKLLGKEFANVLSKGEKFEKTTFYYENNTLPKVKIFSTPDLSAITKEGNIFLADIKWHLSPQTENKLTELKSKTNYFNHPFSGVLKNGEEIKFDKTKRSVDLYNIHLSGNVKRKKFLHMVKIGEEANTPKVIALRNGQR